MYDTLKERFLRYVKFETRSDEKSETIPSTPSQTEFAKLLKKELEEIGLENVYKNDYCIVNGTLPSNIDKKVPVVGFLAHMDTADFNAVNVNPQIIENYDGIRNYNVCGRFSRPEKIYFTDGNYYRRDDFTRSRR